MDLEGITPETAAHGATDTVPDQDLPMLGAIWLARGFDSEPLRTLAGLTRGDGAEARRLLPQVLSSLGRATTHSGNPYDELPWRGYWSHIEWAQRVMDDLLSPYAAAQRVLEVAGDVPDLWDPAGGDEIVGLLARWDTEPANRAGVDDLLRGVVRGLREQDVPPLTARS